MPRRIRGKTCMATIDIVQDGDVYVGHVLLDGVSRGYLEAEDVSSLMAACSFIMSGDPEDGIDLEEEPEDRKEEQKESEEEGE